MNSINQLGPISPVRPLPPMTDRDNSSMESRMGTAPDPRKVAQAQAQVAAEDDQRRAQALASVMQPVQRRRVAVEWHAASLSYVHRILDPSTGEQIQQFPAAQVLDMVDDLMRQIQKG